MIVQLSRFVFTVAGALAGIAVSRLVDWATQLGLSETVVIIIFLILGAAIGYLLGGIVGRELARVYNIVEEHLAEYATTDLILASGGMLLGLVFALIVTYPVRVVLKEAVVTFLVLLLIFGLSGYGGMRIALLKRRDFRMAFGKLNAEDAPAPQLVVKYLDTSAVIDGRFVELRRAGLLEGTLRVPRFVLSELQTLADSADETKRARGKRGLDLLETLVDGESGPDVFQIDYPDIPDVDSKLLRLVRDAGGALVTVDSNLSKVARVQGLSSININEVAAAMRPAYLPGETLRLVIVREGKEPEQGVGYLEDGTMVVVADGKRHIGEEADAEVTSVLQTAVGRMVFARVRSA
ncbi:MAG TPA: TRAM domain-containing protein [Coriobacteriia bacterium]